MRQNSFDKLWPVSALTLGGGGIGMVWGETTFDECVGTVHEAVAALSRCRPIDRSLAADLAIRHEFLDRLR